jgi:hypothetical protein
MIIIAGWICGFDLNHSATCEWVKDRELHRNDAAATETMGGSQRNMHLQTT